MASEGMTPNQRRRFILEELRYHGKVSYEEIRKKAGSKLGRSTIAQDVEVLNELGHDIVAQIHKNKGVLIDRSSTENDSVPERASHRQGAKQRIAACAFGVCCGFGKPEGKEGQEWQPRGTKFPPFTRAGIREAIEKGQLTHPLTSRPLPQADARIITHAMSRNIERLSQTLALWWKQHARMIALDAGTTNLEVAKYFVHTPIPTPGTALQTLTLCTNYRLIFNELGGSNIDTRVMLIGGRQIPGSSAIGGYEALTFLRALKSLHFGVAIIGCSQVDFASGRFEFKTSNTDEAELKSALLERAEIKIILADDGKFGDHALRSGVGFARLDQVDLVITNQPDPADLKNDTSPNSHPSQNQTHETFEKGVLAIRKRGIPVIVVPNSNV